MGKSKKPPPKAAENEEMKGTYKQPSVAELQQRFLTLLNQPEDASEPEDPLALSWKHMQTSRGWK